MDYLVVHPFFEIQAGQIVRSSGWVWAQDGPKVVIEFGGSTYYVPPPFLSPILPYWAVWPGPQFYPPVILLPPQPYVVLPPPQPQPVVLPAVPAKREQGVLNRPPRTLRIFALPLMPQADLHRFILASEGLTLTTGDQSLGEGLAAQKRFHYECEPHKQYVMEDMARLANGIVASKGVPKPAGDLLQRMLDYHKIFAASRQLEPIEELCAKQFLITCCYPAVLGNDVLCFVTCKDAGGQGDIVNALNTQQLLRSYGCQNVHLVMAATARAKAQELKPQETVWLVDDNQPDDESNIRKWPAEQKSERVFVIHVAAQLSAEFEKIVKVSATRGHFSKARTIYLPEYGYTFGSTFGKKTEQKYSSMGFGIAEHGIHILPALFDRGCEGYDDQNRAKRAAALADVESSVAQTVRTALLGAGSIEPYAKSHRLYAGYSHGHGVRFIKLVAHMERFLPHVDTIDVVAVGNEYRKGQKAIYDDLKGELENGGASDLTGLGIGAVQLTIFNPGQEAQRTDYEIQDVVPAKFNDATPVTLADFFGALNPKMKVFLGEKDETSMNRTVFERMGHWLSTPECSELFRSLGWMICTHRNFKDIFGSYLCRQSVSGNMEAETYFDEEMKLKGEEIVQLEMAILQSETIEPGLLMKLQEMTKAKFAPQ